MQSSDKRTVQVAQPIRDHKQADAADYMRYYNVERLDTANDYLAPATYENIFYQSADLRSCFCTERAGSAAQIGEQQAQRLSC